MSSAAPRALLLGDDAPGAELAFDRVRSVLPGSEAVRVSSAAEFAAALREGGFDVVLAEADMPGFSGDQALRMARSLSPMTPFVFLSSATAEERVAELIRQGAADFVNKNRLERLPLAISRAVEEARIDLDAELRGRRRADAFVEGVLESLRGHAVIGMDVDGDIVEWSAAAVLMFGYAREEAIGSRASALYAFDGERDFEADAAAARRHGTSVDSRALRRSDGSHFPSDGVTTALRDVRGEVSGYIKLARDMTATHEAAAALRSAKDEAERAREDAERANKAKDRFLAVLSHELRAPLAPIATAAAALRSGSALASERQDALTAMIQRNVALEARLIDDLFDLSAISSGKLPLSREPVDMRAAAASSLDMVRAAAQERGVELSLDWRAHRPIVDGDPTRLQQILWNLLRNAVKFTGKGGHVRVAAENDGDLLAIEVADDGIGIPEAALAAIFDPFAQADESVARRYGGLGLGLSIAKSLAEMHGGSLTARSAGHGMGAAFTLKAPARAASKRLDLRAAPQALDAPRAISVLLVEDEPDAAEAMALALEIGGATVEVARSLAQARAALCGPERFDAVVADLGLPDGSGLEVAAMASGRIPMIALSGFGGPEAEARSKAAGFGAHLVKPASSEAVIAAVRAGMGRAPT